MIPIALTVAAAIGAGIASEHRWPDRAQTAGRAVLDVMLWGFGPVVVFFNIAHLHVDVDNGVGIVLGWVSVIGAGAFAWVVATRVLHMPRISSGALIACAMQANTGYFGLPLVIALLGRDDVPEAAAYDALVQAPLLMLGVFAVGAAFGDRAGEGFGERVRTFFMRNPLLWAVLAALLAPDALAPDLLVDASRVLVIIQLPLGFFAVGVALATEAEHGELPFPPPFNARIGSAIAIRLLVAPALLIGLAAPFIDLPEPYALLAAMPCGIGTLIVAHAYGLDLRLTAAAVTWSTALVVFAGLCATAIA